jgi:arabinose-5-phosphate isomerase
MHLPFGLMEMRDFKPEDFAVYHPGGAIGKKIIVARKRYIRTYF